jgi:predicted RNA-binding protein with PUA-like domain
MALWLFKEEPEHYSYGDLEKDGTAVWEGVKNSLARRNLRQVRKGDRILYYHTGKEKAIVGEMEAVSDAEPDPKDKDPNAVIVRVRPKRRWKRPVSLAEIKQEPGLSSWELVRLSRLSVMPASKEQWQRVEELSRQES